jgi:predicted XRE-type DNA-binding protein
MPTAKRRTPTPPKTTAVPDRRAGRRSIAKRGSPRGSAAVTFEASSGNVFADMGVPDADDRLAKAELARIIRAVVRARKEQGWTQARAAGALGIAASDMSDLMRGKLARFSQERLAQFLTRLDMEVRIQVGPRPPSKERAEITVERVTTFV